MIYLVLIGYVVNVVVELDQILLINQWFLMQDIVIVKNRDTMENKLYRFRNLSYKDQMRLEVDFGGEPVEIDDHEIDEMAKQYGYRVAFGDKARWAVKDFKAGVKAIKQLLK